MQNEVRQKAEKVGIRGFEIVEEYFNGKRQGTDMVKIASQMARLSVQVEHMNQIQRNADRSFALRLIPYLPKDEGLRRKYMEMTNPEVKPLLLAMPKGK